MPKSKNTKSPKTLGKIYKIIKSIIRYQYPALFNKIIMIQTPAQILVLMWLIIAILISLIQRS